MWTHKASMVYCDKLNELADWLAKGRITEDEFLDHKAFADACYQRRINDINERLRVAS